MGMKPWKKGSVKIGLSSSGDFSLKNAQRYSRSVDESHIKAIIDLDRHSTTRDIAEKLNVSHTCIKKKIKTTWLR